MPSFEDWWTEYLKSGDLEPVRLGISREELIELFGPPHDTGVTSRKHRVPAIYKYGDVEFHFGLGKEGPLWLIYREDEVGQPQTIAMDPTSGS